MVKQDGPARLLELLDEVPQLAARLRVEPGGGLVEKEEIRIADERARERQPLLLSARERDHARIALLLELHERDHLLRRRTAIEEAAEQPQGLEDGQLVGELRLLQLDAQPLAQRLRVRRPPQPENFDVTRVRLGQPLADLDRRRLAGAVRTEQAEALPGRHVEVDAVDGHDVLVGLAKIGDAQCRARLGQGHPGSLQGRGLAAKHMSRCRWTR